MMEMEVELIPTNLHATEKASLEGFYLKLNGCLTLTTKKKVLEILECIDISKAAGTDNVSGKCIKDGAKILGKTLAEIYNT